MNLEDRRNESLPPIEPSSTWRFLDRRIVHSAAIWSAIIAGTAIAVLLWRNAPWWSLMFPLPIFALLGIEAVRWKKSSYRITDEQVEIKTGVLELKHRSVPRDRIRSVDISANPIHRFLGIATVKFGTGHRASSSESSALSLDAVTIDEAESIRRELLVDSVGSEDQELATINWAWLRYAPLSVMSVLLGLAVLGGGRQVLSTLGYELETDLAPQLFSWLPDVNWIAIVIAAVLGMVVIGVIATVGLFIENWWNFRLSRDDSGALEVTRGLFVNRSLTVEYERLRGVELAETLLLRLAGGTHTNTIAAGVGGWDDEANYVSASAVLPPAPKWRSQEVAAQILREERSPTAEASLITHFRAAKKRLVKVALLSVSAVVGALLLLGAWLTPFLIYIGLGFALVIYPIALALAVDAYRNLGHRLVGQYLVTRHGSLKRRTIALLRPGIIGWKVSQWAWHRKTGLCTVTVMTAGGRGGYYVKDVELSEGLRFADESVPGMIDQFLQRRPTGSTADLCEVASLRMDNWSPGQQSNKGWIRRFGCWLGVLQLSEEFARGEARGARPTRHKFLSRDSFIIS